MCLPKVDPQTIAKPEWFWDKLNKSNYYLELSIQHADLPLDDRLVYHLSDDLISDGGQWDMVVNLLEVCASCYHLWKYGANCCVLHRRMVLSLKLSSPNHSTPPFPPPSTRSSNSSFVNMPSSFVTSPLPSVRLKLSQKTPSCQAFVPRKSLL